MTAGSLTFGIRILNFCHTEGLCFKILDLTRLTRRLLYQSLLNLATSAVGP